MIYTTRPIASAEIARLGLSISDADAAKRGWAVIAIDGDTERVIDWYADRNVAEEEATVLGGADLTDDEA